jgi:hypothetical protein
MSFEFQWTILLEIENIEEYLSADHHCENDIPRRNLRHFALRQQSSYAADQV